MAHGTVPHGELGLSRREGCSWHKSGEQKVIWRNNDRVFSKFYEGNKCSNPRSTASHKQDKQQTEQTKTKTTSPPPTSIHHTQSAEEQWQRRKTLNIQGKWTHYVKRNEKSTEISWWNDDGIFEVLKEKNLSIPRKKRVLKIMAE